MNNASLRNLGLLIFRLGISYLMIAYHGMQKLGQIELLFNGEEIQFPDPLGIGAATSLVLATLAEFLGSLLVALGLWTRLASASLLITMIVAVFGFHANDPWIEKQLPTMFLLSYLLLVMIGGGRFSLGSLLGKKFR